VITAVNITAVNIIRIVLIVISESVDNPYEKKPLWHMGKN